jgi:acyl-CoA thioesterase-1
MRAGLKWIVLALSAAACGRGGGDDASAARRAARADTSQSPQASPATAPATARDSSRTAHTVVFVGTSLTAGYGLSDPDQAYPALIQHRIDSLGLNYEVVNAGVSGETSAGALRSIDWLMRQPVDVFVLETGANDGLRALSVDSLRANIQAIFDKVRAAHPDARLVLAGMEAPPNLGRRYTTAFHAIYPELARANDAALIPFLLAGVAGVDSLNQGDGIHPNARGAQVVAENVWKVLGPILTSDRSTAGGGGSKQ